MSTHFSWPEIQTITVEALRFHSFSHQRAPEDVAVIGRFSPGKSSLYENNVKHLKNRACN